MQQIEKHTRPQTVVIAIHPASPTPSSEEKPGKGKGYYADNLAFSYDEDLNSNESIYSPLTQSVGHNEVDGESSSRKCLYKRAVLSGCLLAVSIILLYFCIQYPTFLDDKINAYSQSQTTLGPIINVVQVIPSAKSEWSVEYNLPAGIPLVTRSAKELKDMSTWNEIICPPRKFALVLRLESDADLAEEWLKACGDKVAYFRLIGNPTQADVEKLKTYVKYAKVLSLKATIRLENGAELLGNSWSQDTSLLEDIKSVKISGYVTSKIIEELVEAMPYVEELAINGGDVCSTLRQSTSKDVCSVNWQFLQKLHIFDTEECEGLYDLIYSCWDMPQIKVLQIRKSIINSSIADYIKGIIDRHRIMNVDFADNSCFDEAMQTYPFMCQASPFMFQ